MWFWWWSYKRDSTVLQKIGVNETTMLKTLENRKLSYAGHIMRNTSGHYNTLLTTIEGRLNGTRGRVRPRRTWVDDLRYWAGSKQYEQIKREAETRCLHGTFATHCSCSGRNTQWMNSCMVKLLWATLSWIKSFCNTSLQRFFSIVYFKHNTFGNPCFLPSIEVLWRPHNITVTRMQTSQHQLKRGYIEFDVVWIDLAI